MDNLTPEQRKRSADARRGVKRTPEQKARIAEGTKGAWAEGKMRSLRGRTRPDEVRKKVSDGLVLAHKEGRLKVSGCYMPDFYLPEKDTWIEVKAWLTDKAAKKIDDFVKLGHRLVVITYTEVRATGLPSELKEVASSGI